MRKYNIMKYAICVIMHFPIKTWLDFLKTFELYDVYVLIDNNDKNYKDEYNNIYPTIKFIQIPNDEYLNANFIDLDFPNEILYGWHKSLYYFSTAFAHDYEYIWFMEDDVFFHGENTLKKIDIEFPDSDLLSQKFTENLEGKTSKTWHWYKINMQSEPPYYNAMVCIVRMSKRLLSKIAEYAKSYKTLFFIEAMFPTLAMQNNFICDFPLAFNSIHYRHDFKHYDITKNGFYHPIKNKDFHLLLRNYINFEYQLSEAKKELSNIGL